MSYTLTLKANGWDPALYAFALPAGKICDASLINAGCRNPSPADPKNVRSSDALGRAEERVIITPAASGRWIVVVDSYHATNVDGRGSYRLEVNW